VPLFSPNTRTSGAREVGPFGVADPSLKGSEMSEDLELQRERAAKNQSLFREVNERIEDLSSGALYPGFVCECLSSECVEKVALTIQEYEAIRSNSNRFLVLPGHEAEDVEEVVEAESHYLVVAKRGAGGGVAERLDPRHRAPNR
jgi:hypothetical protein